MSNKKLRKPRALISEKTATQTKHIERSNQYSSTNARAQTFMTTIKQQYESRDIRNIKTAVSAMDSLKANDFDEFKRKFTNIVMAIPIKEAKQNAARDKKQHAVDDKLAEIVEKVDKKVHLTKLRSVFLTLESDLTGERARWYAKGWNSFYSPMAEDSHTVLTRHVEENEIVSLQLQVGAFLIPQ
jgi:hypothetical protein